MTLDARQRRLEELLADERADAISLEERAELESLRRDPELAIAASEIAAELEAMEGSLLAGLAEAGDGSPLPDAMRRKLIEDGRRMVSDDRAPDASIATIGTVTASGAATTSRPRDLGASRRPSFARSALAAAVLLLIVGGIVSVQTLRSRAAELARSEALVEELEARIDANAQLIASAESRSADLRNRNLELARQLATATSELGDARGRIAMYEAPVDPATLARNRERLLTVPDVVQVAWAPFDLGDDPAEQPGVTGDVVWSPSRGEGYLRFVGLAVNDPAVEQYQVWVIDERGMEQKVSGGVFNATQEGEVIVPIDPAIDVGRVQLFAVTIEEPGGIWVPDLSRRVTVAPVAEG